MPPVGYIAPRYLITIEGTELKTDITEFIESVIYEEGDNVASSIQIRLNNLNYLFNEHKAFLEGNKVDLWMGYTDSKLEFMNRCRIVRPNPEFPRSGIPKMSIEARGLEIDLMTEPKKGKYWRNRKDSEIFKTLMGQHNIVPDSRDTQIRKEERLQKKGMSEWQFLQHLSKLNGYSIDIRYDHRKFGGAYIGYFGPPDREPEHTFRFSYGTGESDATLLEFMPEVSLPSATTKLVMTYVDATLRKSRSIEVETTGKKIEKVRFVSTAGQLRATKEMTNGPGAKISAFGQTEEVLPDRRFRSLKEAKRFLASWWARREREFITARGVLVGEPSLRKGQIHTFVLPDVRHSGRWRITSVRHSMAGGQLYETEFTASKIVVDSEVGRDASDSKVRVRERDH